MPKLVMLLDATPEVHGYKGYFGVCEGHKLLKIPPEPSTDGNGEDVGDDGNGSRRAPRAVSPASESAANGQGQAVGEALPPLIQFLMNQHLSGNSPLDSLEDLRKFVRDPFLCNEAEFASTSVAADSEPGFNMEVDMGRDL